MQKLSELVDFVGEPKNCDRIGAANFSLRRARDCISTVPAPQRNSMHSLIDALPTLPDISLTAENVGETSAPEPLQVAIRLNPSNGAILFTELRLFLDPSTQEFHASADNHLGQGGVVTTQLGPGSWRITVRRTGVTKTGYVELESAPFRYQVSVHQGPTQQQQPGPGPVPPTLTVKSNGDGSFKVSGTLYRPNGSVVISVGINNVVANPFAVFTVPALADGTFTDFPTGNICNGLGTELAFTANDGRIDHGHDLTSNRVVISCPA
jgi:hypothetical protein